MWWLEKDRHRPLESSRMLLRRSLVIGLLLSILITLSSAAEDPADPLTECGTLQHRCTCGVPRCIDLKLVNNGEQDCQDASDEQGRWDPSLCAIKNNTSEDIRFKRAALAELLRVTNAGATTTFFEGERGRTRPVGLLTTTMGSFQSSGTTTEYVTRLLATYIKGTYARILSTSSRIYQALPTEVPELSDRPTGFIASTVSTEVHGYATTVHTTDFYRTYIDNTYAQQISSYSNVYYPPWYTEPIQPSNSVEEGTNPGHIYATPVLSPDSEETLIRPMANGRFGRIIIAPVLPTRVAYEPSVSLTGTFVSRNNNAQADLGLVQNSQNELQALRPNNRPENELKVTGTHGTFVHKDEGSGDETTYNVFTGTYVQNLKTFLFFFGNTVIQPSQASSPAQQTIVVENGPQKNKLLVDMSERLRLIVPGTKERTTIDASINGQHMEGVMVEIEGSEPGSYFESDELITVDGARSQTPSDPRIDSVTVTMDRNIKKTRTFSTSSSRSKQAEAENEIPTGRKINREGAAAAEGTIVGAESFLRPTQARPVSLPTYTVGQVEPGSKSNYYDATTDSSEAEVAYNVESSSSQQSGRRAQLGAPVFQRQTTERTFYDRNSMGSTGFSRRPKTFSDFNEVESNKQMNNELMDLQSAASNRHATVTYVGFADFTTTVGNTVIVFMPRTKMIEDLSVHATKTRGPALDPTRFAYTTEEEPPVTTERKPEPEIILTTPKPPARSTSSSKSSKKSKVEQAETPPPTPEIEPSETTILLSGTQTVFTNLDHHDSRILSQHVGAQTILYDSEVPAASPTTSPPKASRVPPRSRYTSRPLASRIPSPSVVPSVEVAPSPTPSPPLVSTSEHFATATTAIYQTEVVNPTGLVTSIGGSVVRDSTTTLFTSLVLGTFIDGSYAQVIKSTSTVYFLIPSQSVEPTPVFSLIRPTPVAQFSSVIPTSSAFSYEVTTTTEQSTEPNEPNPIEETTTQQQQYDRAEVSVSTSTTSSTTESSTQKKVESEEEVQTTTIGQVELDSSEGVTTSLPINPKKEELDEALNEIDRARKVAGSPKEQIIVENKGVLERPTPVIGENEEQTIYITRTVPTTVYRTYTYFTTYFIPKENDETVSSVISREVTSTQVGLVKKTISNVIPAVTPTSAPAEPSGLSHEEEYDEEIVPASARIYYKTFATTYTYLTTFFQGDSSSVSSREEIVSNVVTVTSTQAPLPSAVTPSIAPTSSSQLRSSLQRTRTFIPSPVSSNSDQPVASARTGKYSMVKRLRAKEELASSAPVEEATVSSTVQRQLEPSSELPSVVEETILKTFFTTYTYFSTLFNGHEASTRSRIEVITNVVPTIVRSTISPEPPSVAASLVGDGRETTSYTTYTRVKTSFKDGTPYVRTSLDTYSNVVLGDTTVRSGVVSPTPALQPIVPTARKVPEVEDLNEVASHLSETSETTAAGSRVAEVTTEPNMDYYELESSEMTTERSIYNEHEQLAEVEHGDESDVSATPALKTLFTTFSFFTTYYKGGSSTVSTRLQTVTNVVSDVVNDGTSTETPESQLPVFPITYLTTFTYWTTHFNGQSSIVTSREETISNIVTPGVEDLVSSQTSTVSPSSAITPSREPKANEVVKVEPTQAVPEIELTTFFTTYTYFTSSYIGDSTIINSRLETETNIVTGTVSPSSVSGRAVATDTPAAQDVADPAEFQDYDLPVGLLSTVVNTEVLGSTTVEYSTDVFGTYIDGIYAQVLESTSRVIQPTSLAQTNFMPEATETPTGLLSLNEGKTIEANQAVTTLYKTETFGTVINNQYAHVVQSASTILRDSGAHIQPSEEEHKTGLVRVIDGSVVTGDKTTFYTSSILGTIIDNQYGQIIESTTRYVISPSKTAEVSTVKPTAAVAVDIESSEGTTEEVPATTEAEVQAPEEVEEVEVKSSEAGRGRFNGRGRDRSSRLSFTAPTSKSSPLITPFASRSRPAFVPKRKQSSAVVVTRTDVTPTVTATLAPSTSSSRGNSFQNRPRFRRPNELGADASTESPVSSAATPRLPYTPGRSRFQRPRPGVQTDSPSTSTSATTIQPTSTTGTSSGGSSPRRGFNPRGSSAGSPGRRGSSSLPVNRGSVTAAVAGSSSAGSRGGTSSRFAVRGRPSLAPTRSTAATTVKPTQAASGTDEEYEVVEYEYEVPSSSAASTTSSTTTEAPKVGGRFSNNRFRLNPKLPVSSVSSTTAAPRSTTARDLPFLKRKTFSRPTLPSRSTSSTPVSTEASEGPVSEGPESPDEESPKAEEPAPAPQPTGKPSLKSLIAAHKPSQSRPTSRPRTVTTTPPPTARTTTRRSFAPRARPQGFPSRGLVRAPSSTETSSFDGELEYEESKNLPGNLTLVPEAAPAALLAHEPLFVPESEPDLVGSGSEFFETVGPTPYESYEVYSEESRSNQIESGEAEEPSGRRHVRQVDYGSRSRAILRSNFRRGSSSSSPNNPVSKVSPSPLNSDYDEYYTDEAPPPPPPPPPTTSTRAGSRFRGRLTPTPTSRQTPFTLTNSNSRPVPSFNRRSQSRYQKPTEPPSTTTSRTSRFRSRYRQTPEVTTTPKSRARFGQSPSRGRGSSTGNRYESNDFDSRGSYVKETPLQELGTITVTHYVPAETTIPVINGRVTEYKTILTPSPSVEIIGPKQYTQSEYQGKEVLVFNSELTSTPSFGVTEVTRLIIRESLTTSVAFTPTTIRGRKTSFSHIVPSTVYSVEPVVSTITNNPLTDNNQLTNLLLNQLLGNLNFNPNALLGLGQQQNQNQNQNQFQGDPATPITHYNTRTTTYVTSVTDVTSTVIPITLYGKAIKTTIVESSINVITATEFITESTVVTPSPVQQQQRPSIQQQQQQQQLGGLSPALLQGLLQQQQQLLLQQQAIRPTQPAVLALAQTSVRVQEEPEVEAQEDRSSVITVYVSGKNPGEFSTVLSTVAVDAAGRIKRSIEAQVQPTRLSDLDYRLKPTAESRWEEPVEKDPVYEYADFVLEDSEGSSGILPGLSSLKSSSSDHFEPTESLESSHYHFS